MSFKIKIATFVAIVLVGSLTYTNVTSAATSVREVLHYSNGESNYKFRNFCAFKWYRYATESNTGNFNLPAKLDPEWLRFKKITNCY